MRSKLIVSGLIFIALFLTSCGGSTNTSGSSGGVETPVINYSYSINSGESLTQGESFSVTATLSGGENITDQLIQPLSIIPETESITFSSPSTPCYVSSLNPVCIMVVTIGKATAGAYALNIGSEPQQITQTNSSIDFNVEADPQAIISYTYSIAQDSALAIGESFTVTAVLSGGIGIPDQLVEVASLQPNSESISSTSCNVSSSSPSCDIVVTVGDSTVFESYSLTMKSGPETITQSNANFNFSVFSLLMFVTDIAFDGSLGGPTGADQKCMDAATRLEHTGSFKAMIADGTNRVACFNESCSFGIDWVLKANTTYVNNLGQKIWTTNAQAIFDFGTLDNPAYLNNPIDASLEGKTWSGLTKTWGSITNNCLRWTSGDGANSGGTASPQDLIATVISSKTSNCGETKYLYCAQQ